jgi:hypothetical protein
MTHYMPIFKSKPAEIWAWSTSAHAASGGRVLFELLPTNTVRGAIDNFVRNLARNLPQGLSVIVDASRIHPPTGATAQVNQALATQGITYVPLVRITDSAQALAHASTAVAQHQAGVCLRIGSEVADPDPTIPPAFVSQTLSALGVPSTEVDLVIDFWTVASPRDVLRVVPVALAMLQWAVATGPWRSVTLASGAFPASISGLPTGTSTPVQRFDASFWNQVVATNPPIVPDYGDYGINHPSVQPPVPRGPKPNLRYANGPVWDVYREDFLLPGNESFFTACQRATASQGWQGPHFSTGDAEIARCAQAVGGAGSATQWLSFGASHHIAHVVDRLANQGGP